MKQSVVSIHGPLGYGASTLPLRHSASCTFSILVVAVVFYNLTRIQNNCTVSYPAVLFINEKFVLRGFHKTIDVVRDTTT